MFPSRTLRWIAMAAALAVTACGAAGATPQLIGAHPRDAGASAPPAGHRAPPEHLLVVYDAYLDLEVADTGTAARQATQLAYDYGGYVVSSQSWYQNGRKHTTLTLAVPAAQFDSMRGALLGLGTLIGERVSGELASTGYGSDGWNTYSNITVHFRPAAAAFYVPALPSTGWNPARTFAQAFSVFASVFTFLVDVAIWVSVAVGPFVLMGLGAWALVRRLRTR